MFMKASNGPAFTIKIITQMQQALVLTSQQLLPDIIMVASSKYRIQETL